MTAGLRLFSIEAAKPAVIEIIGRPGSGKSSLCGSLLQSPGWRMEPGAGEPGRSWLAPLSLLLRPMVTLLAVAAASTRLPGDLRRYREVVRVVRKFDGIGRIKGDRVTVVDEGPVHQLLNVFFWSSSTKASRFFTRRLLRILARRPAAFVYLDTPKDVALENTRRRNHLGSWFNNEMSDEVASRYIADMSYDEILETLQSVAPGKLRCFSTLAEAVEFVDAAARTVARHPATRRSMS
jgi:hypothetical protein